MNITLPDGNSRLEEYRGFADVDYIVTDIDGTLVSGNQPVMLQIKQVIGKLKKKKLFVTVATGRTLFGAKERIDELGIAAGTPIALYNGGIVMEYWSNTVIYKSFVPPKAILKIIELLRADLQYIYVYEFFIRPMYTYIDDESPVVERVFSFGEKVGTTDANGMPIRELEYEKIRF